MTKSEAQALFDQLEFFSNSTPSIPVTIYIITKILVNDDMFRSAKMFNIIVTFEQNYTCKLKFTKLPTSRSDFRCCLKSFMGSNVSKLRIHSRAQTELFMHFHEMRSSLTVVLYSQHSIPFCSYHKVRKTFGKKWTQTVTQYITVSFSDVGSKMSCVYIC